MSRFGGEVIYSNQFDVGEMFDATEAVEKVGDDFIAYVMTGWGGGVKCSRATEADAKAELPHLVKKLYGDY